MDLDKYPKMARQKLFPSFKPFDSKEMFEGIVFPVVHEKLVGDMATMVDGKVVRVVKCK